MEAWRRSDPGAVPCLAVASRINRALRSFGWYGMLGELTTLTTALVLRSSAWPIRRRSGRGCLSRVVGQQLHDPSEVAVDGGLAQL
jgi:hypothetical protein